MNVDSNAKIEIPIEANEHATKILQDDIDNLSRKLHERVSGVSVTYVGVQGGVKDAAMVITATAGLIVAATPIITEVIVGFFAQRGVKVDVEADAKAGMIRIRAGKVGKGKTTSGLR